MNSLRPVFLHWGQSVPLPLQRQNGIQRVAQLPGKFVDALADDGERRRLFFDNLAQWRYRPRMAGYPPRTGAETSAIIVAQ